MQQARRPEAGKNVSYYTLASMTERAITSIQPGHGLAAGVAAVFMSFELATGTGLMELDPEMKEWLAQQAAIARQERAELYTRLKAEADAENLERARSVLASIPPPLPEQVRTFVKIYEAPASSSTPDGEIQLIEGTVFDIYSVMTGGMSGDDDFLAFKVISHGDRMTSWRKGSIDLALEDYIRIKFVFVKSVISRGDDDDDHIDDPILEFWIAK
jgi:hypothetical protein